ncbi:MAG: hypothetical protein ACI841_000551 [Planctomycetota bacterium]|jgi:uncharacterized protein (DUF58 family)
MLEQQQLFDTAFLDAAQRLRLVARRVAPRGRFADQRSRDRGSGLEFQDYRPYTRGDDLRAVDWTVYRRLGRVFLRLFEEHEDLPLYLLPDVSRSAWMEDSPRVIPGLRASLALAAVSLGQHDSVGVFPFSDDLQVLQRPTSGKGRLMHFAKRLATLEAGGATDFAASMKRFRALGLREGLVVIVSDFFDPNGLDAIRASLRSLRHKLLLIQLVRMSDREPLALHGAGDLRLVDCETNEAHDVSLSEDVLKRYRETYDRFGTGLAEIARKRGAGLLALDAEADVVPQIARLFENGRREV